MLAVRRRHRERLVEGELARLGRPTTAVRLLPRLGFPGLAPASRLVEHTAVAVALERCRLNEPRLRDAFALRPLATPELLHLEALALLHAERGAEVVKALV